MTAETAALHGWGRTSPSRAVLLDADDRAGVVAAIDGADDRGVVARGLGRSYGDAAQNGGGRVVRVRRGEIGPVGADGRVQVGAGASLAAIGAAALERGWFLAVTPGTGHVTVGGAIACDVHGKNHPTAGTFGEYVESLELVDGLGRGRTTSRTAEPEVFWATVGGMGLTGIVLSAVLQLRRVPSAWVAATTRRAPDLAAAVDLLGEQSPDNPYAAAWIDTLATGRQAGRAVVTTGTHATPDLLPPARRATPHALPPARTLTVPRGVPGGLLTVRSALAFNEAWFRRASAGRTRIEPLTRFLQPLDGVASWNRLYGPGGFVQYQAVVPEVASVAWLLEQMARQRVPSFLAVLKRFGAGGPAPLSFPRPGWTLALDIPAAHPGLTALLETFDAHVAGVGGAVYLAKDSRLRPGLLEVMYPRLGEWQEVRERLDPDHVFRSDLDRRLGLTATRVGAGVGAP